MMFVPVRQRTYAPHIVVFIGISVALLIGGLGGCADAEPMRHGHQKTEECVQMSFESRAIGAVRFRPAVVCRQAFPELEIVLSRGRDVALVHLSHLRVHAIFADGETSHVEMTGDVRDGILSSHGGISQTSIIHGDLSGLDVELIEGILINYRDHNPVIFKRKGGGSGP